ncbi:MAG: prolyl oligopeptidase family serine peptidase [Bacteroidales bacterium]|nr:prolyl oligopeptidase family serine peptidase [Candidatus Cacconaster merdequi]
MKKLLLTLAIAMVCLTARAQQLIVIDSQHLHCHDSILVFIPNQNADNYKEASLPALYLLHGWSGCYRNWADKSDIQKAADESGFIIICPDGFYNSWYANDSNPSGMQYRYFFHRELYPDMAIKYNLVPEKTFITGLSMGGNGSMNIFFDDPSKFVAAGSMSGALNLHNSKSLAENWMSKVLGPYTPDNKRYDEESSVNRIACAKGTGKLLLVSCGYDDSLFKGSVQFVENCRKEGVPYVALFSPGNHSWTFWDYSLQLHLWYFKRILNGENLGYKK